MFSKILRTVLVPSTPFLLAAAPVVSSSDSKPAPVLAEVKKLRRSELPIYPKEECQCKKAPIVLKEEPNAVLDGISVVRKEIQGLFGQSGEWINTGFYVVNTGIAHTSAQIDFIRDEANLVPRIGTIAAGSFLGLLFAIRKGFIKKILYINAGGLGAAALCYPNEADEISGVVVEEGKKYVLVAYHFLNGASKDLIGYELPELPKPIESPSTKSNVEAKSAPALKPVSFSAPPPPLEVPKSKP